MKLYIITIIMALFILGGIVAASDGYDEDHNNYYDDTDEGLEVSYGASCCTGLLLPLGLIIGAYVYNRKI